MQKSTAVGTEASSGIVFTEREMEVLREVVTGASNKEIAQRMNLSVDAIKYHLKNILRKTGCHSRTELAVGVCRGSIPMAGEGAKSL